MASDRTNQKCIVCGSEETSLLIRQPASHHLRIDRIFDTYRCANCKLAFVDDIPGTEELNPIYDAHFFSTSQQSVELDDNGNFGKQAENYPIYLNSRRRVKAITQHRDSGNLLDIGCGKGFFLKAASEHFSVTGTDVSESATTYGRDVMGLDMICGDFHTVAIPEGQFDVVTMWDVLAGFSDPLRCMEKVVRLLKPGGLLVMTLPDIDSLSFKLTRRYWPLLIPPINLYYFSSPSVKVMLENFDLRLLSYGHEGKYLSTNFILRKLGRTLNIRVLDRENIGVPFLRKVYLNLGDIACVYAIKN